MPYTRSSRHARRAGALLAAAMVLQACGDRAGGGGGAAKTDTAAATAAPGSDSTATVAFRNSVTGVDSGWTGPVFQLSHAYPDTFTACTPATCPWLSVPVDTSTTSWATWSPYLQAALNYLVQGQTTNLNDSTGWQTTVNGETRWFHVPWMAYDDEHGREFIHGTTNERTADHQRLRQLQRAGRGARRVAPPPGGRQLAPRRGPPSGRQPRRRRQRGRHAVRDLVGGDVQHPGRVRDGEGGSGQRRAPRRGEPATWRCRCASRRAPWW